MDEPFEIECRGAVAGINSMFGEWQQTFDLEPFSYANAGNARAAFKTIVREQLTSKYVSPILIGFHRTRVEQSGFELVPLKTWILHDPGTSEQVDK